MKTQPFSPLDMFKTEEDVINWLMEAYEHEDAETFVCVLGSIIKQRGVAKVAKAAGLNRESLYRIVNGTSMPRFDTVRKLLNVLGVRVQLSLEVA